MDGRVATKIFEDLGGVLNKAFIRGREPVSIIHYTRPGSTISTSSQIQIEGSKYTSFSYERVEGIKLNTVSYIRIEVHI